ncbi:MAG: hypothetical protein QY310_07200 [Candidatus Jettenia sp. CY-1]|nr:MAG: hypothetical protein QY310_07200 [Candidatus Jettenia sp. CY-1]
MRLQKIPLFIFILFFVVDCENNPGKRISIKPVLDKRLKEIHSFPFHAGLFIEPSLRYLNQEEWQTSMIVGKHHYIFPIGESFARSVEDMMMRVFDKVTVLDELPNHGQMERIGLEAVLMLQLKASELELIVEESVWRAIGNHYLSIQASFFDKDLQEIFHEELRAEGRYLDLIDYETEGGWWKTDGPKYGPAVEDAIEKIVFKLAQKLITSGELIVSN